MRGIWSMEKYNEKKMTQNALVKGFIVERGFVEGEDTAT